MHYDFHSNKDTIALNYLRSVAVIEKHEGKKQPVEITVGNKFGVSFLDSYFYDRYYGTNGL